MSLVIKAAKANSYRENNGGVVFASLSSRSFGCNFSFKKEIIVALLEGSL